MTRRALGLATVSVLMVIGLTGCKKYDQGRKDVQAALLKTEQLSGQFVYDDHAGGTDTVVKGVIADDYRYDAQVAVNGETRAEEVVVDDAVADLFLQQSAFGLLARRSSDGRLLDAPSDDITPTSSGISVLDALSTQRWVIDPTGAPDVLTAQNKHPVGQDPIFDARNVFNYVSLALLQALHVNKYDSESISPTFKTKDDPFPKPAHGSKLVRYDLEPRDIPRKNAISTGADQAVPDVANFRRMVVYVENGLIVRVMEDTTIQWRLDDLKRNYSLSLTGTTDQQAAEALAGINAVRVGQGTDPIRPRALDFQFINPGQSFDVSLPTSAVVGPLHLLVNRGGTAASGSSTPTAAAPLANAPTTTTTTQPGSPAAKSTATTTTSPATKTSTTTTTKTTATTEAPHG